MNFWSLLCGTLGCWSPHTAVTTFQLLSSQRSVWAGYHITTLTTTRDVQPHKVLYQESTNLKYANESSLQMSRKTKLLGGPGTAQDGMFMYSYMSHTYLLQSQVILNFGLHGCILKCHINKKTWQITNTEITEKVLAATKACAQKPCKFVNWKNAFCAPI